MNSNLDLLDEDRPVGRHRAPEPEGHRAPEPDKPDLPSWVEHPNTFDLGLVGEGPTRVLQAPVLSLPMPLPARHPQKARWWNVRFGPLGVGLNALRRFR